MLQDVARHDGVGAEIEAGNSTAVEDRCRETDVARQLGLGRTKRRIEAVRDRDAFAESSDQVGEEGALARTDVDHRERCASSHARRQPIANVVEVLAVARRQRRVDEVVRSVWQPLEGAVEHKVRSLGTRTARAFPTDRCAPLSRCWRGRSRTTAPPDVQRRLRLRSQSRSKHNGVGMGAVSESRRAPTHPRRGISRNDRKVRCMYSRRSSSMPG